MHSRLWERIWEAGKSWDSNEIQTSQHLLGNQKEIQHWWGKYYLGILKDCLWECFRINKCTAGERNMLWYLRLWLGKFVGSILFTVQSCCWIMLLLCCSLYYSVFTCLAAVGVNVSLESWWRAWISFRFANA